MQVISMSASGLRVIAAQATEIKQAVHAVKHLSTDPFMVNNLIEILTSASDILSTIMEEVPARDRRAAGLPFYPCESGNEMELPPWTEEDKRDYHETERAERARELRLERCDNGRGGVAPVLITKDEEGK